MIFVTDTTDGVCIKKSRYKTFLGEGKIYPEYLEKYVKGLFSVFCRKFTHFWEIFFKMCRYNNKLD